MCFFCNANLSFYEGIDFFNKIDKKKMYFANHYSWGCIEYVKYNIKQIPESTSFIDYNVLSDAEFEVGNEESIVYSQACFFGGDSKQVKDFCQEIHFMTRIDLTNGIIPTWHDETYLNKWLYDNYWTKDEKPENIEIVESHYLYKLCEKEFIDKTQL